MKPEYIIATYVIYSLLLFAISHFTSRKSNNDSFFRGNRNSPWYLVAYGMIGASLSGVTFISVPGAVGKGHFSYMVMVLGYLVGYYVIIKVLLPLYYRLNLTSIYTYLESRFGVFSYKSGAAYFLLSRVIGASFRMYIVVNVLQYFVLDHYNIPFWLTVFLFMMLIQLYTMKAGIKTIVWTDTLQTTFMLASVGVAIYFISSKMNLSLGALIQQVSQSDYSEVIVGDWNEKRHFIKQFFSGMFITIVMTGLDQDMMQKNLTCRNIGEAQKNVSWMSISLVPINLIFLFLGAALFLYANSLGVAIPDKPDHLFPLMAFEHMGLAAGIVFIVGLIAAAYSSADSALTALTTSVSVDLFDMEKRTDWDETKKVRIRKTIHVGISFVLLAVIVIFGSFNKDSVINELFAIAGLTYGPLLGLFAFGLFTKYKIRDYLVPIVVIAAPIASYILKIYSKEWFNGYEFGFELLIVNGLFTFIGLFIIRDKRLLLKDKAIK
ncbi:MAG: sodium:solute symporter [Bacteroidales bacterium]|nr:sodium:solute symporter [Bacteroidales bacterium]